MSQDSNNLLEQSTEECTLEDKVDANVDEETSESTEADTSDSHDDEAKIADKEETEEQTATNDNLENKVKDSSANDEVESREIVARIHHGKGAKIAFAASVVEVLVLLLAIITLTWQVRLVYFQTEKAQTLVAKERAFDASDSFAETLAFTVSEAFGLTRDFVMFEKIPKSETARQFQDRVVKCDVMLERLRHALRNTKGGGENKAYSKIMGDLDTFKNSMRDLGHAIRGVEKYEGNTRKEQFDIAIDKTADLTTSLRSINSAANNFIIDLP